jgi:acyl-CoA synthetase (AMP-forming)/AMP-acid ligase II
MLAMLSLGATNVLMPSFDAGEVLSNIDRYRVTHIYVPPTALYAMLDHKSVNSVDTSSLKMLLLVGSPAAPEKIKNAVEQFGPCVCQCYGQVEAPMFLTWLSQDVVADAAHGMHPERLGSCGRSTPHVRLGIIDENDKLLPSGERGEIVVRSPLVSTSYLNLPEATREVHKEGWHHTGDIGIRDDHGFYYIVDRAKDMIVTGGFNVFPAEIEAVILELPDILETAVIGVPDPKWGEAILAVCVAKSANQIDQEQIKTHCRETLGGVKTPKKVVVSECLPRTPNGKIDKKAIRAPYWKGRDRLVN